MLRPCLAISYQFGRQLLAICACIRRQKSSRYPKYAPGFWRRMRALLTIIRRPNWQLIVSQALRGFLGGRGIGTLVHWVVPLMIAFTGVGILNGCAWLMSQGSTYDQRPLTIQTLNLYNQRYKGRLTSKLWKGDWILRRHRLALIDLELRNIKPDLLMFQQSMARIGNRSESDKAILSAGALLDYEWQDQEVHRYEDTQEVEAMALALSPSFRVITQPDDQSKGEMWVLGHTGYLQHSVLSYEDQSVDVFNVHLDVPTGTEGVWLQFIEEKIKEKRARPNSCPKRLIIGGYLPVSDLSESFLKFLQENGLKDVAGGFCLEENRCYTSTPSNEIFLATKGDESPSRVDRILVNQNAVVYLSRRNFANSNSFDEYVKGFGIEALWASQRFGWVTQLRLPRCSESL